jgi:hypothetical protein
MAASLVVRHADAYGDLIADDLGFLGLIDSPL